MRLASVLAAALLLAPLPAAADVTARYAVGKDQLVVEVDDGGDYRAEVAGKFMLIRRGSDEFVVITHNGKVHAARSDVFFTLLKTKAARDAPAGGPGATTPFVTTQGAEETLAGRKGRSWQVAPEGEPSGAIMMVMSADAQLAPVGDVMRRALARALDAFAPIFDGNLSFRDQVLAVFAKGTMLRLGGPVNITLQSVSGDAIGAERFASPTVLLDAPALDAALSEPTVAPAKP